MTTWVTFETIDESQNWNEFYIDRLGVHQYVHQYRQDERTRFKLERRGDEWRVEDLEAEDDQFYKYQSNMRDVIHWVAGRILYGA